MRTEHEHVMVQLFKSRVCVTFLSVQTRASKFEFRDPGVVALEPGFKKRISIVYSVEQTRPAEPVSVHHVGGRCRPPRQEVCLSHTPIHMMTVQHPILGSCKLDLTLTVMTAHVIRVTLP